MFSNLRLLSSYQEQREVKIRTFQDDIENAVERAFSLRTTPDAAGYTKVVVQFFHFINNDIIGVPALEKELGNIFRDRYHYEIRYTILGKDRSYPSISLEVSSILVDISKTHGLAGSLVMVVYSGHGRTKLHNGEQQLEVSGTRDNSQPRFFWKDAVSLLSGFKSDVLQILDCCYAGEAFSAVECEYLTACSATEIASDKVHTSFTRAFTEQLKICGGQPWSTLSIYSEIVRNKSKYGLNTTPQYLPRTNSGTSIMLRKLGALPTPTPVTGLKKNDEPRVVITAHVEEKITPDTVRQLKIWLETGMPSQLLKVKVSFEGVYDADSSILEFRVPVEVWAVLRDDPAYRYVGMSRSGNRLLEMAQASTILVARPTSSYEDMKTRFPSK